jgi:cytochrome c peroxidase
MSNPNRFGPVRALPITTRGARPRPVLAFARVAALWAGAVFSAVAGPPAGGAFASSPEQVELGSKLFFDQRLSADRKVSCASCHQPEKAFTDGLPVAVGIERKAGVRNSPTLMNVGHHRAYFWDGRTPTLEQQVLEPLMNPIEHGLSSVEELLTLLRKDAVYRAEFRRVFPTAQGDAIESKSVSAALAAFVRSLISSQSAIDRYVLEIFRGKAQCSSCHTLADDAGTGRVQLSDQQFHAHGQHTYPMQEFVRTQMSLGMTKADIGKSNAADAGALGRFMVTGVVEDAGGFKTPTLRNVALTAPYFHDGSEATLEGALNRELLGKSAEVVLTENERQKLLAFLRALNDDPVRRAVPLASR